MAAAPSPPPPGLNYIAVISPVLRSVLLGHSFLVLLLPLVYGLLFFSTPKTRRQPVFVLNVFNICLAIAVGIMLDYRGICATFINRFFPLTLSRLLWNNRSGLPWTLRQTSDTRSICRLVSWASSNHCSST